MSIHLRKWHSSLLVLLFIQVAAMASQHAVAQGFVHEISGVVKHVDKDTKTVVVKTADGTEHTINYTDKTVVEGTKDTGKAVSKGAADTYLGTKEGAKITVHYTEEGGKKTATGVKDAVD